MNTGNDDRFAVFILTHGRPHNVKTYRTLRRQGYTGPIYIIIDNEDATADEYRKRYGEAVIMFDKASIAQTFDEGDNFQDRRSVIYARNASFEIARALGLDYFLQLDDDYTQFVHKFTPGLFYRECAAMSLDRLFHTALDFYKSIPALTLAMAQSGDIIGGSQSSSARVWLKRKAMNTFFCSPARPFQFFGRMNDDVNTYVATGNRGGLFLSFYNTVVKQTTTQQSPGGLTDLYLNYGTYVKSFYSVMYAPSCVKVAPMGAVNPRLHHRINWNAAVPCIVGEQHRKAAGLTVAREGGAGEA